MSSGSAGVLVSGEVPGEVSSQVSSEHPLCTVAPSNNRAKTGSIEVDDSSIGSALPYDAESLLQEEMMKLSLQDRNQCQEEIHGVHCVAPEESPAFLKESLRRLDAELKDNTTNRHRLTFEQTAAFRRSQELFAQKNKHTHVNSDEFRLRFLRCELFDVSMAAYHMHRYLGMAHKLFGDFALQRPIRISDFSKAELREFRKGRYQFLPFRDRAGPRGRRILAVFEDAEWEKLSPALRTKMWMYLMYVAGEDLQAQIHGIVVLIWFDPSWEDVSKRPLVSAGKSRYGVALRVSSVHLCTPDTPLYRFRRSIMVMRLGPERSRVKIHVGKSVELMYILQSFGIPIDFIPISFTGKVKEKYVKEWIRLRQVIEDERLAHTYHTTQQQQQEPIASNKIECPYLDDIIFRNGTSLLSHPGNVALRSLIAGKSMHKDNHKKSTKDVVSEIMAEAKAMGNPIDDQESRFLVWNEKGWWQVVPAQDEAKELHSKISRLVRDTRKLVAKQQQQTNNRRVVPEAPPLKMSAAVAPRGGGGTYMFLQSGASQKRQRLLVGGDTRGDNCFGTTDMCGFGFCTDPSKAATS